MLLHQYNFLVWANISLFAGWGTHLREKNNYCKMKKKYFTLASSPSFNANRVLCSWAGAALGSDISASQWKGMNAASVLHVLHWNTRLTDCLDISAIQSETERLTSVPEYHTRILKCLVCECVSLAVLITPFRFLNWWSQPERSASGPGCWLRSVPMSQVTGSHICFVKRGPLVVKSLKKNKEGNL